MAAASKAEDEKNEVEMEGDKAEEEKSEVQVEEEKAEVQSVKKSESA